MTTRRRRAPAPRSDSAFSDLGLSRALCEAVAKAGYETPTPIQKKAIPDVLKGRDLLGCAQTGTGKTAAFALPLLQQLDVNKQGLRVLVLAPTRELAAQIDDSFEKYGKHTRLRHHVIFGGVGKNPQIKALQRGLDVLVATPGRLIDLMGEGHVDLSKVRHLVLDEADRMLDMGFIRDVRRIVGELPRKRQTLLFSATMPKEIRKLANEILRDPLHVAVDPVSSTREPIAQAVHFVEKKEKINLLLHLLADRDLAIDRALVFTRTKHGANKVVKLLDRAGVAGAAIHGNKSQSARERALADFKAGKLKCLVATDIAARGIDIKELSHVINFDLPNEPESYVHRVGRTGRAGLTGSAISFCAPDEQPFLRGIEKLTRRKLDRVEVEVEKRAEPVLRRGGNPPPPRSDGAPSGRRRRRRRRRSA
ncbi:MAG: DEAD/DEAH box helicase [Planctomycetota bacterium]